MERKVHNSAEFAISFSIFIILLRVFAFDAVRKISLFYDLKL